MNLLRYIEFSVLIMLVVVLGTAAHERNHVWKDDLSLWSDIVKKSSYKARPYNNLARAHSNLGLAYSRQGQKGMAIAQHKQALEVNPYFVDAHNNLGVCYFDKGRIDKAISHFQHAIKGQKENMIWPSKRLG